ncbi:MAG: leucyl aminopeptidase, partial [Rhodobacteraceae bacterium]|nr:leucyl aminopeptidase [Paracoccaceae bacterium]
ARKAGAALAKAKGRATLLIAAGPMVRADELAAALALRAYEFNDHKSERPEGTPGAVTLMVTKPEAVSEALAPRLAVVDGVFWTRDLVSEPANVLTTTNFAERLKELSGLGVTVDVLDEAELETLGMRALLAVGQGSASPSKVVVMQWNGGTKGEAPLALIGKGVVFDTGGISLKPAAGMEEMTMDMGGAGTVAGVMKALALRKAKANVVALVGLVENMPSGTATRPGDVLRSMKGDTIEVINTDAEGRLVLADVLWYAQERFEPKGVIDLATLTGAIIIALGHDKAGVFANDDAFARQFMKAAEHEGEGAWRMPLGGYYHDIIKSRIADVKNSGGRPAGSATAAVFLERFIKPGVPWIHLDIAGVCSTPGETALAPKGATGWGVRALDRMIAETETE